MSLFKKPEKGFLSKLFKHKQVEELAEELAHTYADEMQADMLSDNSETDTAEDTAAEQIPMLEVTETDEVDFTEPPENAEGESPPQDTADSTEPSEVRKHLITFRVNDMELEAINRRYAETSFKSRGDFCRYSALTVMNVEEDTEDIKQIARYISSISDSFNQVAHRVNKGGKLYDEDIHEDKLQRAVMMIVNDMIENPDAVENAIMDTMEKCRAEILSIDTEMEETNAEIERICKRRDDILEIITGAAFNQFKAELKELNGQELELKAKLEQLQIRKESIQLGIKKAVTARELFMNMMPLDCFDDNVIPKLVERIDVVGKQKIKVVFRGGVEVEGTVEKKTGQK